MLKKILIFLLCALLLPTFAAAAEIDFSSYSQEELESISRDASLQLLINYSKSEAGLLYDDENFSIYYSSFDKIGDDDYVYLDVILSNKSKISYGFGFWHVNLNYSPFVATMEIAPLILPQSSALLSIPISRDEYEKNPVKSLDSVSLCFFYASSEDYTFQKGVTTNIYFLE